MSIFKSIIIVERSEVAERMQRTLDPDRERIMVTSYTSALHGNRAETIYVRLPSKEWLEQSKVRAQTFEDWIESSVRCRLIPGGSLLFI